MHKNKTSTQFEFLFKNFWANFKWLQKIIFYINMLLLLSICKQEPNLRTVVCAHITRVCEGVGERAVAMHQGTQLRLDQICSFLQG